jgi:long-chain acyl-CoA synthetase
MNADPAFAAIPDLIRRHANERPSSIALAQGDTHLSYAALDALMDRIAASLQRDGMKPGDAIRSHRRSRPRRCVRCSPMRSRIGSLPTRRRTKRCRARPPE